MPGVRGQSACGWGWGLRVLRLAFGLVICAGTAQADTGWSGAYLAMGLAMASQSLALDDLTLSVDGNRLGQVTRQADLGLTSLGMRVARGGLVFGGEIELQPNRRALARVPGCAFGQNCAAAGLIGQVGAVHRLRATIGRAIGPGLLLSGGLGLSRADVTVSHAFAQAASAQDGSRVINTARSPFAVADRAQGAHIVIGLEQRVTARTALRFDLLHERLWVENQRSVYILTVTASGDRTARARIHETGDFSLDTTAVRLSLVIRF
jgi:hypothetical protein